MEVSLRWKQESIYGVRSLLDWKRRKGKLMGSLVIFFDRTVSFNRAQLRVGGRMYYCEGNKFDKNGTGEPDWENL